jgi:hypothetical protein
MKTQEAGEGYDDKVNSDSANKGQTHRGQREKSMPTYRLKLVMDCPFLQKKQRPLLPA